MRLSDHSISTVSRQVPWGPEDHVSVSSGWAFLPEILLQLPLSVLFRPIVSPSASDVWVLASYHLSGSVPELLKNNVLPV